MVTLTCRLSPGCKSTLRKSTSRARISHRVHRNWGRRGELLGRQPSRRNRSPGVPDRWLPVIQRRSARGHGRQVLEALRPELDAILKQPAPPATSTGSGDTPGRHDPAIYQYLPPIDLTNRRLRKLAAALGPAYVRTSGTWANTTYFPIPISRPRRHPRSSTVYHPPAVEEPDRLWERGRCAHRHFIRDELGNARCGGRLDDRAGPSVSRLHDVVGGRIAAAEIHERAHLGGDGGAPASYDAAAYGRDFKVFRTFVKKSAPDMLILDWRVDWHWQSHSGPATVTFLAFADAANTACR